MKIRTDAHGDPFLTQLSEEGFVDLVFRIVDLRDDGTHYRFHVSASHADRAVAMNVVVVKGIQGGFDSDMNLVRQHVYRNGVRFVRSGPESDRLIAVLAELYGSAESVEKMTEQETLSVICLHQGKVDMAAQHVDMKIFGRDSEPIDENDYYESFFNLDLSNGIAYWREKDPEYRVPLLRALSVK